MIELLIIQFSVSFFNFPSLSSKYSLQHTIWKNSLAGVSCTNTNQILPNILHWENSPTSNVLLRAVNFVSYWPVVKYRGAVVPYMKFLWLLQYGRRFRPLRLNIIENYFISKPNKNPLCMILSCYWDLAKNYTAQHRKDFSLLHGVQKNSGVQPASYAIQTDSSFVR
jgi:hypothetical protein